MTARCDFSGLPPDQCAHCAPALPAPDRAGVPGRPCDTYTVWVPSAGTVTARCLCSWAGPGREAGAEGVVLAAKDEMGHLADALARMGGAS